MRSRTLLWLLFLGWITGLVQPSMSLAGGPSLSKALSVATTTRTPVTRQPQHFLMERLFSGFPVANASSSPSSPTDPVQYGIFDGEWDRAASFFGRTYNPIPEGTERVAPTNAPTVSALYLSATSGGLYCTAQFRNLDSIRSDAAFETTSKIPKVNEQQELDSEISRLAAMHMSRCVPHVMDRWDVLEGNRLTVLLPSPKDAGLSTPEPQCPMLNTSFLSWFKPPAPRKRTTVFGRIKADVMAASANLDAAAEGFRRSLLADNQTDRLKLLPRAAALAAAAQCAAVTLTVAIAAVEDMEFMLLAAGKPVSRNNTPEAVAKLMLANTYLQTPSTITTFAASPYYEDEIAELNTEYRKMIDVLADVSAGAAALQTKGVPSVMTADAARATLHCLHTFFLSIVNTSVWTTDTKIEGWIAQRREFRKDAAVLSGSVVDCFDQGPIVTPLLNNPAATSYPGALVPLPSPVPLAAIPTVTLGFHPDGTTVMGSVNNANPVQQLFNPFALIPLRNVYPKDLAAETMDPTPGPVAEDTVPMTQEPTSLTGRNVCPEGYHSDIDEDTGNLLCRACINRAPNFITCPDGMMDAIVPCDNKPLVLEELEALRLTDWVESKEDLHDILPSAYIPQGAGFGGATCPFTCQNPRSVAVKSDELIPGSTNESLGCPTSARNGEHGEGEFCDKGIYLGYPRDMCIEAPIGSYPVDNTTSKVKPCHANTELLTSVGFIPDRDVLFTSSGRRGDDTSCGYFLARRALQRVTSIYSDRLPLLGTTGAATATSGPDATSESPLFGMLPARDTSRDEHTGTTMVFNHTFSLHNVSEAVIGDGPWETAFELSSLIRRNPSAAGSLPGHTWERVLWSLSMFIVERSAEKGVVVQLWLRVADHMGDASAPTAENVDTWTMKGYYSSHFTLVPPALWSTYLENSSEMDNYTMTVPLGLSIDFVQKTLYFLKDGAIIADGCVDKERKATPPACLEDQHPVYGVTADVVSINYTALPASFTDGLFLSINGAFAAASVDEDATPPEPLSNVTEDDDAGQYYPLPETPFNISQLRYVIPNFGNISAVVFVPAIHESIRPSQLLDTYFASGVHRNSVALTNLTAGLDIPSLDVRPLFPERCLGGWFGPRCNLKCPAGTTSSSGNDETVTDISTCNCLNTSRVMHLNLCLRTTPAYGAPIVVPHLDEFAATASWVATLASSALPDESRFSDGNARNGRIAAVLRCGGATLPEAWQGTVLPSNDSLPALGSTSLMTRVYLTPDYAAAGPVLPTSNVQKLSATLISYSAFFGERCSLSARVVEPPLRLEGAITASSQEYPATVAALPVDLLSNFPNYTVLKPLPGRKYSNQGYVLRLKGYRLGHAPPLPGGLSVYAPVTNIRDSLNEGASSDWRSTTAQIARVRRRAELAAKSLQFRFVLASGLWPEHEDPPGDITSSHPRALAVTVVDPSTVETLTVAKASLRPQMPVFVDAATGDLVLPLDSALAVMEKRNLTSSAVWVHVRVEPSAAALNRTVEQVRALVGDPSVASAVPFRRSEWSSVVVFPYASLPKLTREHLSHTAPELGQEQVVSLALSNKYNGNPQGLVVNRRSNSLLRHFRAAGGSANPSTSSSDSKRNSDSSSTGNSNGETSKKGHKVTMDFSSVNAFLAFSVVFFVGNVAIAIYTFVTSGYFPVFRTLCEPVYTDEDADETEFTDSDAYYCDDGDDSEMMMLGGSAKQAIAYYSNDNDGGEWMEKGDEVARSCSGVRVDIPTDCGSDGSPTATATEDEEVLLPEERDAAYRKRNKKGTKGKGKHKSKGKSSSGSSRSSNSARDHSPYATPKAVSGDVVEEYSPPEKLPRSRTRRSHGVSAGLG